MGKQVYTSMFLCFRTRKLHQSTCLLVYSPFSAHFYPPLHHNGYKNYSEVRLISDEVHVAANIKIGLCFTYSHCQRSTGTGILFSIREYRSRAPCL